jgi:hypothetical protein
MRIRFCSTLVVLALLLAPAVSSAAPAPSLDGFLASLGTPVPQPAATGCLQTYQACLAGCGGNSGCQQICQCNYYECRGMDLPTFCL